MGPLEQELLKIEQVYGYYVDLASDEEQGAGAEARIDNIVNDLKVLFQEQLPLLAEDVVEQHRKEKGKAVVMEIEPAPQQQPSQLSIMVLEKMKLAPTNSTECITQEPTEG